MEFFNRTIEKRFAKKMLPNKVLLLLGPRRVGKTFFIKQWLKNISDPVLFLNGEDLGTAAILSQRTVENYKRFVGKHNIVVIDEAQKIPDI